MKKNIIIILLGCVLTWVPAVSALAMDVVITNQAVDINLQLADPSLSPILDVDKVAYVGLEYRNTFPADGLSYPADGDTGRIDGVFAVTQFFNSAGQVIFGTGVNNDFEMTATFTPMLDVVYDADASGFSFSTVQQVGVLSFYVSTDLAKMGTMSTGQGYNDGTMVAQFAVYNPEPLLNNTSGGVMQIVSPFDGSRDMLMTIAGGIDGFFTSHNNPGEEITAINTDNNLDVDNNDNNVPADSPPVPTLWNYPLASPPVDFPFDYFSEIDGSFRFGTVPKEESPGSCRMTGGGNDVNGNIVLGTLANSVDDRYTYGGQIGASTGGPPQAFGEWTHHQQKGPGDKFIFRSGTASAPKDTKILNVFCQDPCNCVNARPAPYKQISWDGTGHFRNISPKGLRQLQAKCDPVISSGKDGSRHYYRVHVNDIGEPGSGGLVSKGNGKKSTRSQCDLNLTQGFPETPYSITDDQCQDCPDTYQIEIHCSADPASLVMYSVGAFVEGGNLQIHPPVGEHLKPGTCVP